MPDMVPVFFESPAGLREWLGANHDSASEVWVGIHKKGSGRPSVTLFEAIDEALCVGWVDSVVRRIDEASYAMRFTPRKPKSTWAPGNIKRFHKLSEEGRVLPAGQAAFDRWAKQQSMPKPYHP